MPLILRLKLLKKELIVNIHEVIQKNKEAYELAIQALERPQDENKPLNWLVNWLDRCDDDYLSDN